MRFAATVLLFVAVLGMTCQAAFNPDKNDAPIWKVFCDFMYHGRVDSLVNPGNYSGHIHKVFGGNHFSASKITRTPVENYYVTRNSPCTSCSLSVIDNSNYWTPDLYYMWPNNTFTLVPNSGLTVYYLSRRGDTGLNKTNPNWQPFPKGLRMLAGDTTRRSYDKTQVTHRAISYVCLVKNGTSPDQQGGFHTKDHFCGNGLRTQVWFPMCWDGVNLDSKDHKSHMAYPIHANADPDNGDCPMSHPVRIPGIFFEHMYSVDQFPHGDGTRQPFVWANGDPTGYGLHGDFVSAWIPEVMAAAIKHPNCSNDNPLMASGNNMAACPPLAPYVKPNGSPKCTIKKLMPTAEDLGLSAPLDRLPGCNPVTPGPEKAVPCSADLSASDNDGIFTIKSKSKGTYLSADKKTRVLYSNHTDYIALQEYWGFNYRVASLYNAPENFTTIQNQEDMGFISAQVSAELVDRTGGWEFWQPVKFGDYWAFKSNRNQRWMTVNTTNNLVQFTATTVKDTELFIITPSNGGHVAMEDGYDEFATMAATDKFDNSTQINIVVVLKQSPTAVFNTTDFVIKLASLLCVDPARIRIVNVAQQAAKRSEAAVNTVVTFAINDAEEDAITSASVAITFQQIVESSPSTLDVTGYTFDISSVAINKVAFSNSTYNESTSTTPAPGTTLTTVAPANPDDVTSGGAALLPVCALVFAMLSMVITM